MNVEIVSKTPRDVDNSINDILSNAQKLAENNMPHQAVYWAILALIKVHPEFK